MWHILTAFYLVCCVERASSCSKVRTQSSAAGNRQCHQTCPLLPSLLNHDRHVFEHQASQGCKASSRQALTWCLLGCSCVWVPQCLQHLPAQQQPVAVQDPRHSSTSDLQPSLSFLYPSPCCEPPPWAAARASWAVVSSLLRLLPPSPRLLHHPRLFPTFRNADNALLSTQRLTEPCSSCKLWELSFV